MYETIQDDEDAGQISYIKLINVGQKIITRNCTGYLPSQVAFYLQNVHIEPRRIYLSLSAEAHHEGGLTENGNVYSLNLAKFIQGERDSVDGPTSEILILTGTSDIEAETVLHLRMLFTCYNTPLLNELRGGDFHGLSAEDFKVADLKEDEKHDFIS